MRAEEGLRPEDGEGRVLCIAAQQHAPLLAAPAATKCRRKKILEFEARHVTGADVYRYM